jgi:hypothetical protein
MVERNFNGLSGIESRHFRHKAVALALLTGFELEKFHTFKRHIFGSTNPMKFQT